MDVKLSIKEEDIGMDNSIEEEVKKDDGEAFKKMVEDEMDPLKEEEIWRSRQERINNALAAARATAQQDRVEVAAAFEMLTRCMKSTDVDDYISLVECLAEKTDLSAVFNFLSILDNSLLHYAAIEGRDDIVRLLIDHVPKNLVAAQDEWGDTPLHVAAAVGRSRAAAMLIGRARDLPNVEDQNQILRIKNRQGNTALHVAVHCEKVDVVRYLLNEDLEPVYWKNASQKSPLFLAICSKDSKLHEVLFSLPLEPSRIEGLPPIHGAIMCNYDLAALILEKNMELFAMTDSGGGNVFHFAAFLNNSRAFKFLRPETKYMVQQRDMNGDLPIHIATRMGHVDIIEKLHPVSPMCNRRGQNILHVAAKYGRASIVRYILRHPAMKSYINDKDYFGNTPLHLAAMHSQPAALIPLLLDERIHLAVPNNKCLTAIDIARKCWARGHSIRKQLAYLVLACSCMRKVLPVGPELLILRPEARDKELASLVRSREETPNWGLVKDFIGSRMTVATLVATVTFAAGFAIPGGFNSSDTASKDDRGMATMLDKRMFQTFVICNTIAMFCSMTAVANLIWAQLTDVHIAIAAHERSTLPLKIALPAMSIAFLTGVTLTVSKLPWLANTIFYFGLLFLLIVLGAILIEYPPFFVIRGHPVRRPMYWLVLAYIYLWGVETYIYDDAEDDGIVSETSISRPTDGAGESKTDDLAAVKCGDAAPPPSLIIPCYP